MPESQQKKHVLNAKSQEDVSHAWHVFVESHSLSARQAAQFERYFTLLMACNRDVNLTAIDSPRGVIKHHFTDSLAVTPHFSFETCTGIVDVGTGAGFPALPLKIMYPDIPMVLLEPNGKKRRFLEMVAQELGLDQVETCAYDWRTFIRTTEGAANLFVSRAALPVEELCRMFKPGCSYNAATLVYWASEQWAPEETVKPFISADHAYKVGSRKRRLIFLQRPLE